MSEGERREGVEGRGREEWMDAIGRTYRTMCGH